MTGSAASLDRSTRTTFFVLLASAIFFPFIPMAGPLSADDLFPLIAVILGLLALGLRRRAPPIDATVLGFAALALVGIWSSWANASSTADFLRLAGRSTGRVLFYQALILTVRALADRSPWPRRAVMFLVVAATVESALCLWAYAARYAGPYGLGVVSFAEWSVLHGRLRVQGTFSGARLSHEVNAVSANFLAAYLVLLIPATAGLALSVRGRLMRSVTIAAAALQTVTLYLTYTRAALAALGVAIVAFGLLLGFRRTAIAALLVATGATLSIPSVRAKLLFEKHDRWALFWASGAITRDHALTGVGDGNYTQVLHDHQKYFDTPLGIATATSHNSVLLAAAHYGVAGGVAQLFLSLMVFVLVLTSVHSARAPRGMRRATSLPGHLLTAGLGAGVIGFLAQDMFNNLAFVPKVATQLWVVVALLPMVAASRAENGEAPPVRTQGPNGGGSGR